MNLPHLKVGGRKREVAQNTNCDRVLEKKVVEICDPDIWRGPLPLSCGTIGKRNKNNFAPPSPSLRPRRKVYDFFVGDSGGSVSLISIFNSFKNASAQNTRLLDVLSKLASSYGYMKPLNSKSAIFRVLDVARRPDCTRSTQNHLRFHLRTSHFWWFWVPDFKFYVDQLCQKRGTKKVSFWSTFSRFWTTFSTTRSHFEVSYNFSLGRPREFLRQKTVLNPSRMVSRSPYFLQTFPYFFLKKVDFGTNSPW